MGRPVLSQPTSRPLWTNFSYRRSGSAWCSAGLTTGSDWSATIMDSPHPIPGCDRPIGRECRPGSERAAPMADRPPSSSATITIADQPGVQGQNVDHPDRQHLSGRWQHPGGCAQRTRPSSLCDVVSCWGQDFARGQDSPDPQSRSWPARCRRTRGSTGCSARRNRGSRSNRSSDQPASVHRHSALR